MAYSTCTKRVWTAAKEIGINVKIVPVDIKTDGHKDPAFIENYHPFGIIPVLEDEDGTKVYESRAIARYLVVKYAPNSPLLPSPSDPKAYGLFEQAASIEYSTFDPPASSLAYEKVFAPIWGLKTNEELCKKYVDTLNSKMEGYERILSKQKYLAGNGTVATTVCSPADVLKSRIMNASGPGSTSTLAVIRTSIQNEGPMFMFKGWVPAWMRLQPTTILIFLTFEQLKRGVDWTRSNGYNVL
ncbi:unnamed protein product [Rhizoctonia solani]|uniref:glutathione transferase n=1 Tax=Rhizoctonia solani TaxID=456999 RepID=A0A8H2XI26_9AGAM|nr:unnamed protein product [Rhizoctonia solani]